MQYIMNLDKELIHTLQVTLFKSESSRHNVRTCFGEQGQKGTSKIEIETRTKVGDKG